MSYFHYCTQVQYETALAIGGPGKREFKTEEILGESSAKTL